MQQFIAQLGQLQESYTHNMQAMRGRQAATETNLQQIERNGQQLGRTVQQLQEDVHRLASDVEQFREQISALGENVRGTAKLITAQNELIGQVIELATKALHHSQDLEARLETMETRFNERLEALEKRLPGSAA